MQDFSNFNSSQNSHRQSPPQLCEEKFNEIVAAICDGRYSWACVLLLQAAGYNPIHYIPPRTYKRLIKMNRVSSAVQQTASPRSAKMSSPLRSTKISPSRNLLGNSEQQLNRQESWARTSLSQQSTNELIQDVDHLAPADDLKNSIQGGFSSLCWFSMPSHSF